MLKDTSRRGFVRRVAATAAGLSLPGAAIGQQETEAFERAGAGPSRGVAASWFTKAGLGLFLHWGPCSVGEVEISWGMFGDVGAPNKYWPLEKYLALADRFDPQNYDPNRWFAAAAKAGFGYVVLTTRHHDGYALWPSEYGNFSTRQHMHGRDLVRPYVEACRKNGLKVGFYYSPTDWTYNMPGWPHRGFPLRDPEFKYRRPERTQGTPRYAAATPEEYQKHFDQLYAYVKGQVGELLTRYGKIDLLWWDGWDWPKVDHHGQEMQDFVHKLQPGIVLNDRWRLWSEKPRFGDFNTAFEGSHGPKERPKGAWEQCEAMCGGWSYRGPQAACKPTSQLIERLVRNRAWGGNYLADFGPRPDGTMAEPFYATCDQLAAWMRYGAESVRDVEGGPHPERCDVPVTVRGATWYLHFLTAEQTTAAATEPRTPKSARLLRTGQPVAWKRDGARLTFTLPQRTPTECDDVVAVRFA